MSELNHENPLPMADIFGETVGKTAEFLDKLMTSPGQIIAKTISAAADLCMENFSCLRPGAEDPAMQITSAQADEMRFVGYRKVNPTVPETSQAVTSSDLDGFSRMAQAMRMVK